MTDKLPLTFACGSYDRMDAITKGEIQPADIDLNYIPINNPRDIFDRMIGGNEFDASEMSLSEYICRYADGERDLVAIPVFPSRAFRHGYITINTDLVQRPTDLNGKRIGVQLYTMTAAVWIRAALADAGVDLSTITWVEGAFEKPGPHGKAVPKPLLRPVKRTGIFPIMHVVVIKKAIVHNWPFVVTSMFNACNDSKDLALHRMKFSGTNKYMLPFLQSDIEEIEQLFGGDPWPYGLEKNRSTLEAFVSYLYEQAMIPRKIPIEELFAPVHCRNLKV
ncbi:hypothetical protein Plec18170_009149 [Paecilomyces lecythidis]